MIKKNVQILILLNALLFMAYTSNAQVKTKNKSTHYAKIKLNNFLNNSIVSSYSLSADTNGISNGVAYNKKNEGNVEIYLIHKNGGNWWCKQAKKKFPNYFIAEEKYASLLLKKDSVTLKDYNKWAFFTDKKYLIKVGTEGAEGDNGVVYMDYYGEKPNTEITILLYEQKMGSKKWVAIDSLKYTTDSEGGRPKTKDSNGDWHYPINDWEFGFIRKKMEESNAGKKIFF